MADASPKLGKIFIGGLSYETTDDKLRSYFGAYGTVTDAVVMKDPISRRSRGFGFITYADPACVDRALAQPNHVLDSRRVEAKRAVPRAENSRENSTGSTRGTVSSGSSTTASSTVGATKKIFVGGLHYETKDADFKKYFEQYGKVVSAEVMFNRETNKSRGFGFVVFEVENSVEHVLQSRSHVIDGKAVEVKRAVPRTDAPPSRGTATTSSRSSTNLSGSPTPSGGNGSAQTASGSFGNSTTQDQRSVEDNITSSRSFAAIAAPVNGTLGGYAAAVRYGGRVPPLNGTGTSSSEDDLSTLAENMNSVYIDDDQEASSQEAAQKQAYGSGGETPQSQHHASPSNNTSSQPSESQSLRGQEGISEKEQWQQQQQQLHMHAMHHPQFNQLPHQPTPLQWQQMHQPQWQQQWQQPIEHDHMSHLSEQDQHHLPQPSFFSMFSTPPDSGSSTSGGYRPSWDGGYGSSTLGMGMGMGMGIGITNMGIGMDASGIGNGGLGVMPGMTRGGLSSVDPSGIYGFGVHQAGLGMLQNDSYHRSDNENSLESSNIGMMSSGMAFSSNVGSETGAGEGDQAQSDGTVGGMSFDYASYRSQNATDTQFQGYR